VTGATITGTVRNDNGTLSGTTLSDGSSVSRGTIAGNTTADGTNVMSGTNTGSFYAASNVNQWNYGSNSGTMDQTGGTLRIGGSFTNTGTATGATITGSVTNTSGTLDAVSLDSVTLTGGTLQGTDTATGTNSLSDFSNTGTLDVNRGNTTLSGTLDGGGNINVGASATLNLSDGLEFTGGGDLSVNGGTVNVQGAVDPLDTLNLNGGTLNLAGEFDVTNANLNSGTVAGTGSFGTDTNLSNSGVALDIGGDGTIGQWILDSYTQSGAGSLSFDILDSGQDSLTLLNGGTLSGTVFVDFNYSGPLTQFTLISGLEGNSNVTVNGLPNGWTYSLTNGDLMLDGPALNNSAPDPPTVLLIGGALVGLGSLRRRLRRR
jgi:hypothetical protein